MPRLGLYRFEAARLFPRFGLMKCFALTLGARNTGSKKNKFLATDEREIQRITARYFPEGFSILNVKGGWFDPAQNKFIKEESRQIWVSTSRSGAVKPWARALAAAMGQKEILIVELGRATRLRAG